MRDYVEIQYDKIQLALLVEGMLKNPKHIKAVSSCIAAEMLNTEAGVKNLILASKGLEVKLSDYKLKIGSIVKLNIDKISSWRLSIENMKDAQIILDNTIEARVTGFDRTKMHPIQVTYSCIDDSGNKYTEESFIRSHAIINL